MTASPKRSQRAGALSQPRMTAAESNKRYYASVAADYDGTEDCVIRQSEQARLFSALNRALALTHPRPRALDACGGSGNAGVALARHGIIPVVVDVSQEMIDLWCEKARALGHRQPEVHVRAIEDFLAADDREWDLITFCSALHHLEDYASVLEIAAGRLSPGGVIFTMFDPTVAARPMRLLREFDWRTHLAFTNPRRFAALTVNALRRDAPDADPEAYIGRWAERHADAGIDDHALVDRLRARGLHVVVHDRYTEARLGMVRWLLRQLGWPSHFHLVIQRPLGS